MVRKQAHNICKVLHSKIVAVVLGEEVGVEDHVFESIQHAHPTGYCILLNPDWHNTPNVLELDMEEYSCPVV